jgi:hypothetical protein
MPDLINQRHYRPRFPGGTPLTLRRSRFLGGSARTYFAPGQDPRATGHYQNPTDWPAAGTLLRVPQVVWLSGYFGYFLNMQVHATIRGPMTLANPSGLYPFTNHYAEYHLRFRDMLDAVAARVNALRPNRTWVLNAPWLNSDLSDTTWALPLGGSGSAHNKCLQLLAPPQGSPFFGTDFLHVNLGMAATSKDPVGGTLVWDSPHEAAIWYDAAGLAQLNGDVANFLASDTWQRPRADWVAARGVMRGASTRLYGCRMDWSDLDPALDAFPFDYVHTLPAGVDFSNTLLRAMCEDMADEGYAYGGDCDDLTADALVALIAGHFGFDPGTGRDL